jgi:hypothetical protein
MSDELAFPTQMWDEELKEATWLDGGLTKRELFAAMAMQWLISSDIKILADEARHPDRDGYYTRGEMIALYSMKYADALLAELAKERP